MDFEGAMKLSPEARKKYRNALKKWQNDLKRKAQELEKKGIFDIEDRM